MAMAVKQCLCFSSNLEKGIGYVTNKMEKCNEKKDTVTFLSNNLKVRGNYEH